MYRTQITRFSFSKLSKWPRRCSKTCKVSRRASCPLCTSCIICSCWCIHTLGSNGWTCMLTQLRVSHHSGTAHDCLHPQNNRGETELLGINTPRTKKPHLARLVRWTAPPASVRQRLSPLINLYD